MVPVRNKRKRNRHSRNAIKFIESLSHTFFFFLFFLSLDLMIIIPDVTDVFWPVGFELFQDQDSFGAQFIQSDILETSSKLKSTLNQSCDIVYLGLLLHLFSYDLQVEASKNIVELTKGKGSIILGKSGGWDKAGVENRTLNIQQEGKNKEPTRFRHDRYSFTKMWTEVAKATNTKWNVHIDVIPDEMAWRRMQQGPIDHKNEWLYFTCTRLQ